MAQQTATAAVEIAGSADIGTISGIRDRMIAALQDNANIVLDLTGLCEADITLVQLLEAIRIHAVAAGKTVTLRRAADDALSGMLDRGGFLSLGESRAFWSGSEGAAQ